MTTPEKPNLLLPKIRLGVPRDGWLDVFFGLGVHELRFAASAAVVDSLAELVDLGMFTALQRSGEQTCTFFIEPSATHVRITRTAHQTTLSVVETAELNQPQAGDRAQMVADVDPRTFSLAVWRAFREAESRWCDVGDNAWQWPFPSVQVRRLGQLLGR